MNEKRKKIHPPQGTHPTIMKKEKLYYVHIIIIIMFRIND